MSNEEQEAPSFIPVALADLKRSMRGGKDELLQNRFLCRKGGALLVGPSGIGKSSFVTQIALCWSIGKTALGIKPPRPLTVLIIQAENDAGDMAEQRDGVIKGMYETDAFNTDECEKSAKAVKTLHVCTVTGDAVGDMLKTVAQGYDLVILDPLFAFIGGDVMSARDVSHFLREVINPAIAELNAGIIIIHHTNKPPRGNEKDGWKAGDFAYLGAGSAELTNWLRGIIAIRSIGSDTVFELRVAKRGKRLEWMDNNGNSTTAKLISHSEHGICWKEMSQQEAEVFKTDAKPKVALTKLIERAKAITETKPVWKKSELRAELADKLDRSPNYIRQNIFPPLRECGEFNEKTAYKGSTPVNLIGDPEAVKNEFERIQNENI